MDLNKLAQDLGEAHTELLKENKEKESDLTLAIISLLVMIDKKVSS